MQNTTAIQWNDSYNEVSLKTYNAFGNSLEIVYPSQGNLEIDLSAYPEGIYNVVVNSARKQYTTKIFNQ